MMELTEAAKIMRSKTASKEERSIAAKLLGKKGGKNRYKKIKEIIAISYTWSPGALSGCVTIGDGK